MTSGPRSEYADVTDMFRRLVALDEQSIEYRRQREVIIERCLPLANHIAGRVSNRGEPLEDLVQVARVGLIHAVNRFDAENGADFLATAGGREPGHHADGRRPGAAAPADGPR